MSRIINQIQHRDSGIARSPESGIKLSPAILLVIVILSGIFSVYGILHIIIRFFRKRRSLSSVSHSAPYQETPSSSGSLPRQLQQLFRLQDSGLDQSAIDALPIFHYKDITGLSEPLDCAVCLCEFTSEDTLRLIPTCSHAFHSKCIDTWLLSSSTCPLCRGTLSSNLTIENPLFDFNGSRESLTAFSSDLENENSCDQKVKENSEMKLLSVRLGKFRSLDNEGQNGEIGGCNLDGRRCFSMGSSQYVVGDSDLQVALSNINAGLRCGRIGDSADYGDMNAKKISSRVKCESFSVSKIWLWSKKEKIGLSMTSRTPAVLKSI